MIAADLSHRDLGRTVAFDLGGFTVVGDLLMVVAHPGAVSLHLKHHGEEPYDLPPTHPLEVEEPREASQR